MARPLPPPPPSNDAVTVSADAIPAVPTKPTAPTAASLEPVPPKPTAGHARPTEWPNKHDTVLMPSASFPWLARVGNQPAAGVWWLALAVSMTMLLITAVALWRLPERAASASSPQVQAAFDHYLRGIDAFKLRHWQAAEQAFAQALQQDPSLARARHYAAALAAEQAAQSALLEAQTAHRHGAWLPAIAAARRALNSSMRPDAKAVLEQIDAEVAQAVQRSETLLRSNRPLAAAELLQPLQVAFPRRLDVGTALLRARLQLVAAKVPSAWPSLQHLVEQVHQDSE